MIDGIQISRHNTLVVSATTPARLSVRHIRKKLTTYTSAPLQAGRAWLHWTSASPERKFLLDNLVR